MLYHLAAIRSGYLDVEFKNIDKRYLFVSKGHIYSLHIGNVSLGFISLFIFLHILLYILKINK